MAIITISVEKALNMRDKIKKKIDSRVNELGYAYSVCIPSDNEAINKTRISYHKDCRDKAKSCYQSLSVLAFNYDILSAAIMKSNHDTKLTQRNSTGEFMTVAEGISILESSPTPKIYAMIKQSRDDAMEVKAKNPNGVVIDPFGDDILKTMEKYDKYCESLRDEIDELNKTTMIEVSLID